MDGLILAIRTVHRSPCQRHRLQQHSITHRRSWPSSLANRTHTNLLYLPLRRRCLFGPPSAESMGLRDAWPASAACFEGFRIRDYICTKQNFQSSYAPDCCSGIALCNQKCIILPFGAGRTSRALHCKTVARHQRSTEKEDFRLTADQTKIRDVMLPQKDDTHGPLASVGASTSQLAQTCAASAHAHAVAVSSQQLLIAQCKSPGLISRPHIHFASLESPQSSLHPC